MKEIVKNFTIPVLILLAWAIVPLSVRAFSFEDIFDELDDWLSGGATSTQIINEVNVSANTGGNTATGGEVKEGETKTEVEIKNIINGNEIEPIDIESTAGNVSVTSEIKVEDGKAEIQREIEIDSEKKTENYEVNLENPDIETENKVVFQESLVAVQRWWSNFIEDIKSFFGNIFSIF